MAKERRWYYERDGVKRGPFFGREIRHMVRTGEILATDLMWKDGMQDWVVAGSMPKLFKQIGQSQRSSPSALMLSLVGLLAISGIIISPLGDLTRGWTGMPYVGSIILSGVCLTGALVTFVVAMIGKEIQPLIVPAEGRLLKDSAERTGSAANDEFASGSEQADVSNCTTTESAVVQERVGATRWRACVQAAKTTLCRLLPHIGQARTTGKGAVVAGVVVVGAVFVWLRCLTNEKHEQLVAGEVSHRGKPVNVGLVTFTPLVEGKKVLRGSIRDGRYALTTGHGSDGGTYTMRITGFTGIPRRQGAEMDLLGDEAFPTVTRTVLIPCSAFTLNVECEQAQH
jgi:hypothetical protein